MAISDAWLKANNGKIREKTEVKSDRDGLSARVSPKGKIVFQLRYRYNNQAKRIDIGTYPLTTLKKARAETVRFRQEIEQGNDPKIVKALELTSKITALSNEELIRDWYEKQCKPIKASHSDILRSFEIHVFPTLANLPAKETTLHHWLDLLEPLAKKRPSIADRVLTNAKQALKWGVKRKLLDANPLGDIHGKQDLHIEKKIGTRSLNHKEIKNLWIALNESGIAEKNRIFCKLCLLYGCRKGELRLAHKQHFDFEKNIWTVPPENHKMGLKTKKPLLRPIISETKALIEEAMLLSNSKTHLFTRTQDDKPMGETATLTWPYNLRQWLRSKHDIEMEHWSIHDLRKTARTNWSELTEPHIAEIMLGHKLPGVWQTYDHHHYLEEQAEAYKKWCQRVTEITSDTTNN